MATAPVLYEQDGPLAFVTFNRPDARNAMTWAMYDELYALCDAVESDSSIRVLILRGAGGQAFVAGSDINEFRQFDAPEDGVRYEQHLDSVLDRIEGLTKPTVAEIDGVTTGGGCALAAACDLRLCSPASRFGVPIARTLGNCLSAANHARFLDLLGPARLKDLLFSARLFDAAEALAVGFVNRIVEAPLLDGAVRRLAHTIAANAPLTIMATKEMIRRIQLHRRLPPDQARDLIVTCYTSADFREGVDSFLSKRPPQWSGT